MAGGGAPIIPVISSISGRFLIFIISPLLEFFMGFGLVSPPRSFLFLPAEVVSARLDLCVSRACALPHTATQTRRRMFCTFHAFSCVFMRFHTFEYIVTYFDVSYPPVYPASRRINGNETAAAARNPARRPPPLPSRGRFHSPFAPWFRFAPFHFFTVSFSPVLLLHRFFHYFSFSPFFSIFSCYFIFSLFFPPISLFPHFTSFSPFSLLYFSVFHFFTIFTISYFTFPLFLFSSFHYFFTILFFTISLFTILFSLFHYFSIILFFTIFLFFILYFFTLYFSPISLFHRFPSAFPPPLLLFTLPVLILLPASWV